MNIMNFNYLIFLNSYIFIIKVIFIEVCGGIIDEVIRCIFLFLVIYFCLIWCIIDKFDLIFDV